MIFTIVQKISTFFFISFLYIQKSNFFISKIDKIRSATYREIRFKTQKFRFFNHFYHNSDPNHPPALLVKGPKIAKIFHMGVLKKTRKTVLSIGKRQNGKFRQKIILMGILTKISKNLTLTKT